MTPELHLTLVPPNLCHLYVGKLVPHLEKSEKWTKGRATVVDIIQFIFSGRMNLWMVYEKGETNIQPYGYVITEIKEYPEQKWLVIQYCAGERNHMDLVEEEMHEVLELFAKDAGCAGIEFFGRPGWSAHVKKFGYTGQSVVYEKTFAEVQ